MAGFCWIQVGFVFGNQRVFNDRLRFFSWWFTTPENDRYAKGIDNGFQNKNFSDEIGYPVKIFKNEPQKQIQVLGFVNFARDLISIFALWRQKQVIRKKK